MLRIVTLIGIAIFLARCASSDSAGLAGGGWSVERRTDPITGAVLSQAMVGTTRVDYSSLPDRRSTSAATLGISCERNKPVVMVTFDLPVVAVSGALLEYRFDGATGSTTLSPLPISRQSFIWPDAEVSKFLQRLRTAARLDLRVTAGASQASAHFDVRNGSAAIDAAACH